MILPSERNLLAGLQAPFYIPHRSCEMGSIESGIFVLRGLCVLGHGGEVGGAAARGVKIWDGTQKSQVHADLIPILPSLRSSTFLLPKRLYLLFPKVGCTRRYMGFTPIRTYHTSTRLALYTLGVRMSHTSRMATLILAGRYFYIK